MTARPSPERLAEIRATYAEQLAQIQEALAEPHEAICIFERDSTMDDLLAEIDARGAQIEALRAERDAARADHLASAWRSTKRGQDLHYAEKERDAAIAERDALRADLATARADGIREGFAVAQELATPTFLQGGGIDVDWARAEKAVAALLEPKP